MKRAYVFLNGQIEGNKDFYIKLINEKKGDIYCADGGANHLESLGILPLEIWGDLDSVTKEIIEKYRINKVRIKKFPKDKDYTDGELILQHISKLNYNEIIIIGGLGGRIDHLLTNLNLIFKFKNLIFVSEKERIFSIEKKAELRELQGKTISFVPFSEKVEGLTLEGFKYPLSEYTLHQGDSICMSNVAVKDTCRVTFNTGKLMGIVLNK